jgi:hypothetical protein
MREGVIVSPLNVRAAVENRWVQGLGCLDVEAAVQDAAVQDAAVQDAAVQDAAVQDAAVDVNIASLQQLGGVPWRMPSATLLLHLGQICRADFPFATPAYMYEGLLGMRRQA